MRLAFIALLVTASPAAAHIALRSPAPRTTEQKTGPCGAAGSTRGTKVTRYQPGETITVEWDETVDHPGHFPISFDSDGNEFTNPMFATDNYPETLVEPIADKTGGHYTQQVTLPSTPCTNCTLQLMQIMTTTEPYNSFYYQCADITLSTDAPPPDTGGDGGGCSTTRDTGFAMVLGVGLLLRRRRR